MWTVKFSPALPFTVSTCTFTATLCDCDHVIMISSLSHFLIRQSWIDTAVLTAVHSCRHSLHCCVPTSLSTNICLPSCCLNGKQVWNPNYSKDIDLVEGVQRRATKLITGMQNLSYDDRVKRLGLIQLNARGLKSDLVETWDGNYSIHSELLFQFDDGNRRTQQKVV